MKKLAPFVLFLLLLAVAAWYFFTSQPETVHELPPPVVSKVLPAEPAQTEIPVDTIPAEPLPNPTFEPAVEAEPEVTAEPLPLLNESDDEVTRGLGEIVGSEVLAEYLVQTEAISRFVSSVDRLNSRQVPPLINPIKPAEGDFVVETDGENVLMSPRNFARYDGYVTLLQNTDAASLVGFYQHYQPLFQQAFEENGGEGSFNHRLVEVIDQLSATPDVPGPVYLTKPEAVYLFEEPELEALTAGQKILIRMGSVNATLVKEKLEEIRAQLVR